MDAVIWISVGYLGLKESSFVNKVCCLFVNIFFALKFAAKVLVFLGFECWFSELRFVHYSIWKLKRSIIKKKMENFKRNQNKLVLKSWLWDSDIANRSLKISAFALHCCFLFRFLLKCFEPRVPSFKVEFIEIKKCIAHTTLKESFFRVKTPSQFHPSPWK